MKSYKNYYSILKKIILGTMEEIETVQQIMRRPGYYFRIMAIDNEIDIEISRL